MAQTSPEVMVYRTEGAKLYVGRSKRQCSTWDYDINRSRQCMNQKRHMNYDIYAGLGMLACRIGGEVLVVAWVVLGLALEASLLNVYREEPNKQGPRKIKCASIFN